eukprot:7779658-Alexandrium_andersonii.AAC.1
MTAGPSRSRSPRGPRPPARCAACGALLREWSLLCDVCFIRDVLDTCQNTARDRRRDFLTVVLGPD